MQRDTTRGENAQGKRHNASYPSDMPLRRCAVLHELIVPDKNATRFPAQLVGIVMARRTPRDSLANSLRRSASRLANRHDVRSKGKSVPGQSQCNVPSLSPLTLAPEKQLAPVRAADRLGRMHLPVGLACRSPISKRAPLAVGNARAYAMMRRQPSTSLHAELALPKPSLLPLPPPPRRLLPLGGSRRSSGEVDSKLLPPKAPLRPPQPPAAKPNEGPAASWSIGRSMDRLHPSRVLCHMSTTNVDYEYSTAVDNCRCVQFDLGASSRGPQRVSVASTASAAKLCRRATEQ